MSSSMQLLGGQDEFCTCPEMPHRSTSQFGILTPRRLQIWMAFLFAKSFRFELAMCLCQGLRAEAAFIDGCEAPLNAKLREAGYVDAFACAVKQRL